MTFCAPGRGAKEWTCFNTEELLAMADTWNKSAMGKIDPIIISSEVKTNINHYLWSQLQHKFQPFCSNNEACWLDSIEFSRELKRRYPALFDTINYFTLKPKGTKGKNDWLSTIEIDYVMQQYERLFDNFKYIGCFPSDYYKIYPKRFPDLNNYRYAAVIFNLDSSHQKGSHWIAIFFETTPNGQMIIEYFDPTGEKPNKNLGEFLDSPLFTNADIYENAYAHQRGNSECGMYSMFYILERLHGKTLKEINEKRISDKSMNEFRSYLFRPYTERFSSEKWKT